MQLFPPSAKQARSIREATGRLNVWHGSVRSGKTVASMLKWADVVNRHDGNGDLVMVGKTERTLKRNILRPLMELLGERAVQLRGGAGEARILGRLVYLIGANDERSEQKIRGGTFAKIYGDEITLWPESFFKMALTRLSTPGAQFFGTTNPDSPMHWLKRDFLDRADELGLRSFHFVIGDNTTLDPEYVSAIGKEFVGLWHKRFVEGLWVVAEGAIWDAFDSDAHAVAEVPAGLEFKRYFVAIDYGTSNPFVALMIGEGLDGRYWVVDEWRWDSRDRGHQLTDAQYGTELGTWIAAHGIHPSAWYVDPSAASFKLELVKQQPTWPVQDAVNDVGDGLRTVATLIGQDRVRILRPKCERLLAEISGYRWDPRAQERGEDAPIKANDHGPDALRYGLHSEFQADPPMLTWMRQQAEELAQAQQAGPEQTFIRRRAS